MNYLWRTLKKSFVYPILVPVSVLREINSCVLFVLMLLEW